MCFIFRRISAEQESDFSSDFSAAKFNNFAKSFIDSLYQIYDISDLEEIFKKVIFENQDIKKEERLSKIHILFDSEISSASKIIKFLTNSLELKK